MNLQSLEASTYFTSDNEYIYVAVITNKTFICSNRCKAFLHFLKYVFPHSTNLVLDFILFTTLFLMGEHLKKTKKHVARKKPENLYILSVPFKIY